MRKPVLLLYRINGRFQQESWQILASHYILQFAANLTKAFFHLTHEHIACIVAGVPYLSSSLIDEIFYFRSCFKTVPIVVYGISHAPETFESGFVGGPLHCIPRRSFERVMEEIPHLISEHGFTADLADFGIVWDQCPLRIKKALDLIQRNFLNKDLSIANLASQLNVHRCHFEREFQHYCQISPKQLLTRLRLFFSCFLMKNDGMKLWHIALLAGFSDYYEFSKRFHKYMGMTPSEFRRTCCESDFFRHFNDIRPNYATKPHQISHFAIAEASKFYHT